MGATVVSLQDALRMASDHVQASRLDEAVGLCRLILGQRPGLPAAARILGDALTRAGRSQEAADVLGPLLAASPGEVTTADAMNLGISLRRLGNYEESARTLQGVVDLQPDNPEIRAQLNATLRAPGLSPKEQDYQANFERWRLSPYMDYPRHIQVETLAICNASCFFCPYPKMERQGDRMSDALFEKIVSDLEKIPRDLPFELELSKVNEPFVDKRIFDFYRMVNERLPQAVLFITTNGSALTERALDRLATVRNVGWMCVSMNDHRLEAYEKTMGLPYARTIEALHRLHERVANGSLRFPVSLSRVGDGSPADQEFIAWAKQIFPRFSPFFYSRFDWIRQVDVEVVSTVPRTGCKRWFDLSIMASGKVALCCIDGEGKYAVGDVTRDSVLDVYNSPGYRKLREATPTRVGDEPCGQCSYF